MAAFQRAKGRFARCMTERFACRRATCRDARLLQPRAFADCSAIVARRGLRREPQLLASSVGLGQQLRRTGARLQQPRQIESIILSTFASSRSIAGFVPSKGPFMGRPAPDDGSAVPSELVPGVAALVPKAPPIVAACGDPMPPRANAAPAEPMLMTAQRM